MSPLITPGKYDFVYNESLGITQLSYDLIGKIIFLSFIGIVLLFIWLDRRRKRILENKKIELELQEQEKYRAARIESDRKRAEENREWAERIQKANLEEEKIYAPIRKRNNEIIEVINNFILFAERLQQFKLSDEIRAKFILRHEKIIIAAKNIEEDFYQRCDAKLITLYEMAIKELDNLKK